MNILIISKQSLEGFAFIINVCKLLILFQQVFEEPVKSVHLQELASQLNFSGALVIERISTLVIERISNYFVKQKQQKFCRMAKEKRSKKIDMGSENLRTDSKFVYI